MELRSPGGVARSLRTGRIGKEEFEMAIDKAKAWDTSMLGYADELKRIVAAYQDARILELGAGRRASFTLDEMAGSVQSYTVNDIDEEELSLLPGGYDKACFDVCGDASNFADSYDVVFSRFLAEHVPDGETMHRNVFEVLRPGGTAFHLIPTLYAMPFLINKYMPERLTQAMLRLLSPRRSINPKFPAPYSGCYANPSRMTKMLKGIGYREVEFRNFYGHFYYEKIPVLKQVHEKFSEIAADRDWHFVGTYAYIKASR
ncbi:bifunctional 2-polyprenyl-6-hydroxyphenol methylase/3-demethylubiquinol 3-O-methyltransferase UbiG [Novosphingobium sp. Gsoil 351]|uniref:class I SAM-dependent methyltransferase n=1 Tax=Novosphingobium sp. Gsoil 351 TaxID=2675225 RepID=UPI0018A84177|nr:class I SAM-dependent methyltransferase [Novosphingobium sp. Gsoil 351]